MHTKENGSLFSQNEVIKDPNENWLLRPDVAGYEYPEEGSNWRIGIVRNVVEDEKSFESVSEILTTPFTEKITRNMARVILTKNLLQNPPLLIKQYLPDLEVLINLEESGVDSLKDCYQAIFSRNATNRQTSEDQITIELANVQKAFDEGRAKFNPPVSFPPPQSVSVMRLNQKTDPRIIDGFVELVSHSFAEEGVEMREGIDDKQRVNMAAVSFENKAPRVIGTTYADEDTDTLLRGGAPIKLVTYEIKGAIVNDEYRNRGVYTFMSQELYRILARKKQLSCVFGYSNVEEPSVIAVAAKMGRSIVTETAHALDLQIKPTIKQTLTDGKLVDEIVTYMAGNRLRELYGKS